METERMKLMKCEFCGNPYEGSGAPCGAEICPDYCKECYEKDGFCEDIDSAE